MLSLCLQINEQIAAPPACTWYANIMDVVLV